MYPADSTANQVRSHRAAVTGLAGLSSLGIGPGAGPFFERLLAGETGIQTLQRRIRPDAHPTKIGAEIPEDTAWSSWLQRDERDHQHGLYTRAALAVFRMAAQDANVFHFDPWRTRVFAAHGHIDHNTIEHTYRKQPDLLTNGKGRIHPLSLMRAALTAPAAAVARAARVSLTRTVSEACPSGIVAFSIAADEIQRGHVCGRCAARNRRADV